jgi:Uma2 family endonuclease
MSITSPIGQIMAVAMPPEPVCRLAVSQYHEMIAAGILASDEPVELLEGWIVPKMVKNPPHSTARHLTTKALESILPSGWHVRSQEPITLSDSEPEPDVAIVCGGAEQYEHCHPGAESVAVVVEVADASLGRDRSIKNQVYARAGIPVYWIVNLQDRRIEVYTVPSDAGESSSYRQREDFGVGSEAPLELEGREVGRIAVAAVLPVKG